MSKPKNTQENIDSPSNQPKGSTPEIFLPLGNLRLKTNFSNSTQSPGMKKQEAEEDDEVEAGHQAQLLRPPVGNDPVVHDRVPVLASQHLE